MKIKCAEMQLGASGNILIDVTGLAGVDMDDSTKLADSLKSKYGSPLNIWELHENGKIVPPQGMERVILLPTFDHTKLNWETIEF